MTVRIHRHCSSPARPQTAKFAAMFALYALGITCFLQCLMLMTSGSMSLAKLIMFALGMIISIIAAVAFHQSICNTHIMNHTAKRVENQYVIIDDVGREWCGYCYRHIAIFQFEKDNRMIRTRGELIGIRHDEMPRPGDNMIITTKSFLQPNGIEVSRYEWSIPQFHQ